MNTTSADRDIEIYIEHCDDAQLLAILVPHLGAVRLTSTVDEAGLRRRYDFPEALMILERGNTGFSSCWLRGKLPWLDDVEMARIMHPLLQRRIFCDPGSHYPELLPQSDAFLLVDARGERIVDIENLESSGLHGEST
jgi:hypothetical protein